MIVVTTSEDIAAELGRGPLDSIERAQVQRWIDDAAYLIGKRAGDATLDPTDLDYVVRRAVVAVASAPRPGVVSQSVGVDDATETTRFERGGRAEVTITPEWWKLLGLNPGPGGAFAVDMTTAGDPHQSWCSLAFGAAYCSCGTDLAGEPLWEP